MYNGNYLSEKSSSPFISCSADSINNVNVFKRNEVEYGLRQDIGCSAIYRKRESEVQISCQPSNSISSQPTNSIIMNDIKRNGFECRFRQDISYPVPYKESGSKDNFPLQTSYQSPIIERKKEKQGMSLILMMKNRNGLVAIADSKSTIANGQEEEKGRNPQKLFKGNRYIIGTYGVNHAFVDSVVRIEDTLRELVRSNPDYCGLVLKEFQQLLRPDCQVQYNFIVGYRLDSKYFPDNHSYLIEGYSVTANGIQETFSDRTLSSCQYVGMIDLMPRNVPVNGNWTLEEMKGKAELLMNTAIQLGDEFLTYNPVGGKLQIETIM